MNLTAHPTTLFTSTAASDTPPQQSTNPVIQQSALETYTLTGLADLLGCTRTDIRNFADRLGFRFSTQLVGARHKRVACVTIDQASAIAAAYEADISRGPLPCPSYSSSASYSYSSPVTDARCSPPSHAELPESAAFDPNNPQIQESTNPRDLGYVYLLQLEPDCDPGRFKVGFSSVPYTRINDLLTAAPFAQCVAMWPARRSWEHMAIVAISQHAMQLREEVYRGADIQDAIAAGDKYFASLPYPVRREPPPPARVPETPTPLEAEPIDSSPSPQRSAPPCFKETRPEQHPPSRLTQTQPRSAAPPPVRGAPGSLRACGFGRAAGRVGG